MRAAIVRSTHTLPTLENIQLQAVQPGEVLVRFAASGICGSDLAVTTGKSNVARNMPMILGHEGAGVVEETGAGVIGIEKGDHVVVAMYGPCGHCQYCSTGRLNRCDGPERASTFGQMADGSTRFGLDNQPAFPMVGVGSLAEYAIVRQAMVVKINKDLPLDSLCLAGCGVTTGLGAVFNTAQVQAGNSVVVIGCGGVGLNVIQGARIAGAPIIIGIDKNPKKLDLASNFGATHCLEANGDFEALQQAVHNIVPGGADFAFEVVGIHELLKQAFALTCPGGSTVMIGAQPWDQDISVNVGLLMADRKLLGCTGGGNIPQREISRIANLYQQGNLKLDELIGARYQLDEIEAAFKHAAVADDARTVVNIAADLL